MTDHSRADLGEWDAREMPQLFGHREFMVDEISGSKQGGSGDVADALANTDIRRKGGRV